MVEDKPLLKKRKYSRQGCNECRRRKMKCDEGKPHCYNCTRLEKVCVYKAKFQFKDAAPVIEGCGSFDISEHGNGQNNILSAVNKPLDKKAGRNAMNVNMCSDSYISFSLTQEKFKQQEHKEHILLRYDDSGISDRTDSKQSSRSSINFKENDLSEKQMSNTDQGIMGESDFNFLLNEANMLIHDLNNLNTLDFSLNSDISAHSTGSEICFDSSNRYASLEKSGQTTSEKIDSFPFENDSSSSYLKKSEFEIPEEHRVKLDEIKLATYADPRDINASEEPFINSALCANVSKSLNLSHKEINDLYALVSSNLSYHIFPFAKSIESNRAVYLLLKYSEGCSYLVYALLAFSTRLQFNLFRRHQLEASQVYIQICLKELSNGFEEYKWKRRDDFPKNIERLLLTVLLLSSNFASVSYTNKDKILNSWKYHLRAARDLLIHFSDFSKNMQEMNGEMSAGLALAKSWFFSLETCANICTPMGGTLTKIDELDYSSNANSNLKFREKLFIETGLFDQQRASEYYNALLRQGFIFDSNSASFGLFPGYTNEFVYAVERLSHIVEHSQKHVPSQIGNYELTELLIAINSAKEITIIPGINRDTFEIMKDSRAHPEYEGENKITLPLESYSRMHNMAGYRYFSWYDLTHQVHVDSLYMKLYSTDGLLKLPKSHPLIKKMLKRMLGYMFYIRDKKSPDFQLHRPFVLAETQNHYILKSDFDSRTVMSHSAYHICISLASEMEEMEKLGLYFTGLIKLGIGSGLNSLEVLKKFRSRLDKNRNVYQQLLESDYDIIQEMDVPPFI